MHKTHHPRGASVSTGALRGAAVWALLLCALSSPAALAQHRHAEEGRAPEPRPAREAQRPQAPATGEPGIIKIGGAKLEIPDVEVLNQDGRKVRFYSDLIKGRVVVLSFFFTSCTFVCPMQGRALAKLQERLGARVGKDVFIVSITKDPQTDSASNLKQWGEEFGVGPGWTLVTGEEGVMTKLLWDFSGERPGPLAHSAVVLIGNDRTGIWTDAGGLSAPARLIEIIDRVAAPVE